MLIVWSYLKIGEIAAWDVETCCPVARRNPEDCQIYEIVLTDSDRRRRPSPSVKKSWFSRMSCTTPRRRAFGGE